MIAADIWHLRNEFFCFLTILASGNKSFLIILAVQVCIAWLSDMLADKGILRCFLDILREFELLQTLHCSIGKLQLWLNLKECHDLWIAVRKWKSIYCYFPDFFIEIKRLQRPPSSPCCIGRPWWQKQLDWEAAIWGKLWLSAFHTHSTWIYPSHPNPNLTYSTTVLNPSKIAFLCALDSRAIRA